MNTRVITNEQLVEVEQIIMNGYRTIDTRLLESHLYAMLASDKFESFRVATETLVGRIHHYLLTADVPVVHLDYKRGMDEIKYWAQTLYNGLMRREDIGAIAIAELLKKLVLDINSNEEALSNQLSALKWTA